MLSLIWLHIGSVVYVQVSSLKLELLQLFKYPVEFNRSNLIALENRFKTAQKVNIEPPILGGLQHSWECCDPPRRVAAFLGV